MRKRGASLIWALVMSTTLLFVTTTFANVIIAESQMSIRMDDSSRAYAAAESGIEWGKYCLANMDPCSGAYPTFHINYSGATADYTVTVTGNTIESIGTINNVNRKLEYTLTNNPLSTSILPTDTTLSIPGSYVQQFDYWTNGTVLSASAWVGVADAASTNAIYLKQLATDRIYLVVKVAGVEHLSSDYISVPTLGFTPTGYYGTRVRVEYKDGIYAKMTVSVRSAGGEYACAATSVTDYTLTVPVSAYTLPAFTKFFYSDVLAVDATVGDGSVYKMGTRSIYLDNMATSGITNL